MGTVSGSAQAFAAQRSRIDEKMEEKPIVPICSEAAQEEWL
jgi:hypothetical protein